MFQLSFAVIPFGFALAAVGIINGDISPPGFFCSFFVVFKIVDLRYLPSVIVTRKDFTLQQRSAPPEKIFARLFAIIVVSGRILHFRYSLFIFFNILQYFVAVVVLVNAV